MKITIGHILVMAGLGGYVAFGHLPSPDWFRGKAADAKDEYVEWKKLFKSGEAVSSVETPPKVETKQMAPPPPVRTVVEEPPVPKKQVKKSKPVKPKVKKTKVKKKKIVKKKVVRKKKSNAYAGLLNSYVEVELKSGRNVRGVLRSATKTQFVVELPGLGPFTYEAKNVKSIKKAT